MIRWRRIRAGLYIGDTLVTYALLGLPFAIDERGDAWVVNVARPIPSDSPALAEREPKMPSHRFGVARAASFT